MKKALLMISLFLCIKLYAQNKIDTIYIDNSWKISTKDNASYYRLVSKEDEKYKVLDYYMDGMLQMSGTYKTINLDVKDGYFKYYSKNGNIYSEGNYIENNLEGIHKYYDEKTVGVVIQDKNYKNGKRDGTSKMYYGTGQIWAIENYTNDKLNGESTWYYEGGKLKRKESYSNGVLVEGKCYTESGLDTTYFEFEQMPVFKGGDDELMKYLSTHIIYPTKARRKGIEGRVIVQFVVNVFGDIEDINIMSDTNPLLNEAAIDVIKKMPAWTPGYQDGKPVSVKYALPISFKLN